MFSSNAAQVSSANYIEDVFSTWLYTGDDTNSRVITNGIDLAGKGGMVITAPRNPGNFWSVADTARGASNWLYTQSTGAQQTGTDRYGSFDSTGYTMGSTAANGYMNYGGYTYASWTFRKQPKFMAIATWTGNGAASQVISHDLGSVPGFIIVKAYSGTSAATGWWYCYHRSLGNTQAIALNDTGAATTLINFWRNTDPTSTQFTVGSTLNDTSTNFIAYVFAHNAGGFGLTGTDNVISCGSFTTDGSGNATVNLGYEPQWVMVKNSQAAGYPWYMADTMRGMSVGSNTMQLLANSSAAEASMGAVVFPPNATGFNANLLAASNTYIYIAIRRGPMKVPTDGTSVFSPVATSAATGTKLTTGFPVDLQIFSLRTGTTNKGQTVDRLRGVSANTTESGAQLITNSTAAETTTSIPTRFWDNTGFQMPSSYGGTSEIFWNFRRAPGFFDEVCYSGNSTARTINHNLSAVPELMIVKARTGIARDWAVYTAATTATNFMYLNATDASGASSTMWNDTTPTASVFTVGTNIRTNNSGQHYVAYLFASCPGVSKVGSYTGTGATQTISCGFTGGARFVLIKRTDSTGDWYVWDSARGIVAGNDPYLLLNSTAAEVTSTDYVDTYSAGFEISSTAPAAINASGGTFIYLAIA